MARRTPIYTTRSPGIVIFAALAVAGGALAAAAQGSPHILLWEQQVAPLTRAMHWVRPQGPVSLYAVRIGRGESGIQVRPALSAEPSLSLKPLSQLAQAASPSAQPIAALNGDYFYYPSAAQPGLPTGAALLDGELVRTPFPRSCLTIGADGRLDISIYRSACRLTMPDGSAAAIHHVNHPRRPDEIVLYTPRYGATTRTPASGVEIYLQPDSFPLRINTTVGATVRATPVGLGDALLNPGMWVLSGTGSAGGILKRLRPGDRVEIAAAFSPAIGASDLPLGGGPRLLRNGVVRVEQEGGSLGAAFSLARHPRSAVGFNDREIWLLAVDGRQPGHSAGATLAEVGEILKSLGCSEGMNLDGGGSTALWVRGQLVNSPSTGRERSVANALVVEYQGAVGPADGLQVYPPALDLLPGPIPPVKVRVVDRNGNTAAQEPREITWSGSEAFVHRGRLLPSTAAPSSDQTLQHFSLTAESAGVQGELAVRLHRAPARIEIHPGVSRISPGGSATFRVRALGVDGRPLSGGEVQWSSTGVGSVSDSGQYFAGADPGSATVTASVGGVSASAVVEVGTGIVPAVKSLVRPLIRKLTGQAGKGSEAP